MYQLVYVSTPITNCNCSSVADLQRAKVISNQDQKIAGCITFYERGFLHFLEGEKSAVLRTFLRLTANSADHHLTIIYACECERCIFDRTYILEASPEDHSSYQGDTVDFINSRTVQQLCNPPKGEALAAKLFSVLVKEQSAPAVSCPIN